MGDWSELKKVAEAAPEGPWFGPEYAPNTGYVFDNCLGSLLHYESIEYEQESCLRYVAAANPSAVLALIDENDRLQESHNQICTNYNQVSYASEERGKQIDQLKAENEALRKDAERYRWIRDFGTGVREHWDLIAACTPEEMGDLVDSLSREDCGQ